MLKLKYLFENYPLAKEALKKWEHDENSLDEALTHFRISSNAIYPFFNSTGLCFLRLSPTEEKLEKNIVGELEFIDYLMAHDYPALRPIKAISGEYVVRLSTEWGEYFACAFEKADGIPIEKTDMSEKIMYEYGKALGKLHSLSSEFKPRVKKWAHTEVLGYIKDILNEYKAPEFVFAELYALQKQLEKLPVTNGYYGLVHYDFEPDNVFYDESTGHCSVIDFDDGMYNWYALDIEQVLSSLAEELDGEALSNAEAEFIRGYKSEHAYTAEMAETLPLMKRFIELYGYARLIRCVSDKFDNEPDWLAELRQKLEWVIGEKEKGMR